MKRISVLITCYREGRLIRRAVESLDAQTDQDFDVVLVDDASPDPVTKQVCREVAASHSSIRLIRHERNLGLAGARDTGFRAISGEVCVPLDADDELPPEAISLIREGFSCHPDAGFLFGDYLHRGHASGEELRVDCSVLTDANGRLDPTRLCRNWKLLGTSPCTKSLWRSIGGYREKYANTVQDVDFWMRALMAGAVGVHVPEPLYIWNIAGSGMNRSPETYDALFEMRSDNIAFFDSCGEGVRMRKALFRYFAGRGDYERVRSAARGLAQRGGRGSAAIYGIAGRLPVNALRLAHQAYLQLRRVRLPLRR